MRNWLLVAILVSSLFLMAVLQPANADYGIGGTGGGGTNPLATAITGCTSISSGGTYVLQNDITTTSSLCININSNSVIFDGNGFTITGPGSGIGIQSMGTWAPTVKNIAIKNFAKGMVFDGSWGVDIQDVAVTANTNIGIMIPTGGATLIRVNASQNSQYGIYLGTSNIPITDSTAIGNGLYDFYAAGTNNKATNFKISSDTFINFTASKVALKSGTSPGNEPLPTLGKYITAASLATGATLALNISYTDADVVNAGIINENTLKMARYDGTWYTNPAVFATSYGVDTIANYVYASMTNPSGIYGPLGASSQITGCLTTISVPGEYKLNSDLNCSWGWPTRDAIKITASNVVLDCQNNTIRWVGTMPPIDPSSVWNNAGISVYGNNVTVKNCKVDTFRVGIYTSGSNDDVVTNNVLTNNLFGIHFERIGVSGARNYITNNNLSINSVGINVEGIDGVNVSGNILSSPGCSKWAPLFCNPSSILEGVALRNGAEFTRVTGNTITGPHAHGVIVDVYGLNNEISANNISNSVVGIQVHDSSNTIKDNTLVSNSETGIKLEASTRISPPHILDNTIVRSNTIKNSQRGISVTNSTQSNILSNILTNNNEGIYIGKLQFGNISSNTISGGTTGVLAASTYAQNNYITSNTISGATTGMSISGTNNNITSNTIITAASGTPVGIKITGSGATGNNLAYNYIDSKNSATIGVVIENGASGNVFANGTIGSGNSGYWDFDKSILIQNANGNKLSTNTLIWQKYAVYLLNANNTEVYKTTITGFKCSEACIKLVSSSNNNISTGSLQGISVMALSNSHNNIIGGFWARGEYAGGVYLNNSNNNLIQKSTLIGGASSYKAGAIKIENSVGNTLVNLTVSSPNDGLCSGVLLVNSNYTSVTGTKVDGTVGYNGNTIKLDNSHYNTLNNTDNGGFLRSIYLVGSTNNVINGVFYRDYSILSNQGIVLNSSSNNVIENCQYISAWDNCIKITQNSNNNILRNNVLNGFTDPNIGRGAGLIISNSVGTEAYNNTITNWPVNLWLLNADNSEFTNNTITNAVPIGQSYYPCLYDSAECPAQILWGTGAYSTSGSTDNTFDQNIIKNNVVHGIWFKEASLTPLNTQILNSNFTATLDSTVCLRKTYAGSTTEDYNNYVSCGTAILSENSEQDPIAYNTFRDSIIGIHFINTINSQIYDNNFINTVRPIVLEGTSGNTFTANTGSGNGIAITGQTSADTFTNNIIGEIPATTVTCGQTLTTSTKLANSLKCSSNGLTLSGDNIFLTCNGKTLTGIRNPTTQQLRGTGVTVQGSNSIVDGCNITGFALAVDLGANPNVMSNDNLSKNAKGVSFVEYLKQTFANIDWDP